MLKVICDISTLVKPKVNLSATNKSISEIPVTISALSIGILVIAIIMVRGVFFILLIAIAAAVPIMVAISADKTAIINVVYKAFIILSFLNSSLYQRRVKPPHLALDFELLKDNKINIIIGAYKNNIISPT